jgi:hypothetical protein
MADNAPLITFLFCVTSHMSKCWAAAQYVVCGGSRHESFRRLSAQHIYQSSVCYNYNGTTPNGPVSESGIKSRPWCVPVLLLSRMPLSFLKTISRSCHRLRYALQCIRTHFLSNLSHAFLSHGITSIHNSSFTRLRDG